MTRLAEGVAPSMSPRASQRSVPPLAIQFRWLRLVLVFADTILLVLSFGTAYVLRFTLLLSVSPEAVPDPSLYVKLGLIFIPVWIFLFYLLGLYERTHLLGGTEEYSRMVQACTLGMGTVVLTTFLFVPLATVARGWVVYSWVLAIVLGTTTRFLLRRVAYSLRSRGYLLARAIILSGGDLDGSLVRDLSDRRSSGLLILGFLSPSEVKVDSSTSPPHLGSLTVLPELLRSQRLEEVIVDMRTVSRAQLLDIMRQTANVPDARVQVSTGLYEIMATGPEVRTIGSASLTTYAGLRLSPRQRALKGLLDYTVAGLGIVLFSPVFLLVAGLVKWTSPGPVFHRRRVLGTGARAFEAFKFRTMWPNGADLLKEEPDLLYELQEQGKIKEDPRVTPVGQFLRKYSIDELPQLLNVLRGEMSLVGPRIITSEEVAHFGPFGLSLLTVKPGMTGLWQVSGRSDLGYVDRVRLDIHYIRNYSIWKDLQILFVQTLPAVIKGRGAY